MNYDLDMPPYIQEMADWLDDDNKAPACNFENACLGAEIMLALQRSAAEGGQVALPLASGADEQALLKAKLAAIPCSCRANRTRRSLVWREALQGLFAQTFSETPETDGLRPQPVARQQSPRAHVIDQAVLQVQDS